MISALEGIRNTARDAAAGYLSVAQEADRAIDAVKWTVQTGKVVEFPALYTQELDAAQLRIQAGAQGISSAESSIQLIVSGSTSSAIQNAIVSLGSPILAAPTYQRVAAQKELDEKLQSLWGSQELAFRRQEAWTTLAMGTTESSSQAAHTIREIVTVLLDRFASNDSVKQATWWKSDPQTRDGVSKRQKIRFFIVCRGGTIDDSLLIELDSQVDRAFEAHDHAIKLAHHKVKGSEETAKAAIADLEEVLLTLLRYRITLGQCP